MVKSCRKDEFKFFVDSYMLTLSIQQPWAWAICHAGKDIENRTWPTMIRGKFLIHAGKKFDTTGYEFLREHDIIPEPDEIFFGGIVGIAKIVDCVSKSDSQWFFGPYGFVLREQRPLAFMPLIGKLRFFDTKYEINN